MKVELELRDGKGLADVHRVLTEEPHHIVQATYDIGAGAGILIIAKSAKADLATMIQILAALQETQIFVEEKIGAVVNRS